MLAHLPPHVLGVNSEPQAPAARARRGGTNGRVERQVAVVGAGETRPRVLPATQRHERAVTVADRAPLQPVWRPRLIEDTERVDRKVGDAGSAFEFL